MSVKYKANIRTESVVFITQQYHEINSSTAIKCPDLRLGVLIFSGHQERFVLQNKVNTQLTT